MNMKITGPWNQHWKHIQPCSQSVTISHVDLAFVITLGEGGVSMCVSGCGCLCVLGGGVRGGRERSGSSKVWVTTLSAVSPQKKASASTMWLRLEKLHIAGNGEGLEWRVTTFGKCGNVRRLLNRDSGSWEILSQRSGLGSNLSSASTACASGCIHLLVLGPHIHIPQKY